MRAGVGVGGVSVRVGDVVVIPFGRGFRGEVTRLYPAEPTCQPTALVRYLDGPYEGREWGGYQHELGSWEPS